MKKKVVWLILSCLMAVSLVLASCGTATEEGAASPEEEEATTDGPIAVFEKPEQPFSIGETARSSRTAVTVLEVVVTDSYEYYDVISKKTATKEATAGMSFVLVTMEIENVGSLRRGEGDWRTRLIDSERFLYQRKPHLREDVMRGLVYLTPDEKMRGTVLFEVPKDATGLKVRYGVVTYPAVELENEKWAEWQIE